MQKITIDAQLANDIGNYLAQRPWAEVNGLIGRLMSAARPAEASKSVDDAEKVVAASHLVEIKQEPAKVAADIHN